MDERKLRVWKIILRNVISLIYCLAELSLGYKPENLMDRQK
jgi:hypothetical protein